MLKCSLCEKELIGKPSELKRRQSASKSGLLFCSKPCKNEALRLGRAGEVKFSKLVPQHYGVQGQLVLADCLFCLGRFTKSYPSKIYCSQKCSSKHRTQKLIEQWLQGDILVARNKDGSLKHWARQYILKVNHYSCSRCRWSEVSENGTIPVEVDHIDGDWLNSSYSNLRALCPNCHSLTKNYKIYNMGNNLAKPGRSNH